MTFVYGPQHEDRAVGYGGNATVPGNDGAQIAVILRFTALVPAPEVRCKKSDGPPHLAYVPGAPGVGQLLLHPPPRPRV